MVICAQYTVPERLLKMFKKNSCTKTMKVDLSRYCDQPENIKKKHVLDIIVKKNVKKNVNKLEYIFVQQNYIPYK